MRAFQQVLIFVTVLSLFTHEASAQPATLRSDAWMTDGQVLDVAQSDGITYIGGQFNNVLMLTGNGTALSMRTGTPFPMPRVNGIILAVVPDGAGGWYIGGDFTRVNDFVRNRVAHLRANGTLDAAWNPDAEGRVSALALRGTIVYAGGEFARIGGQDRNNIAALNAATGQATDWNPNANDEVRALAVEGQIIYAGGAFTTIGGLVRNYIAALDSTTGMSTPWDPNLDGEVNAVDVSRGAVYIGGSFSMVGTEPTLQTRNNIAAIDAVTGVPLPFDPDANGTVRALVVSGNTVYAGGSFSNIGGRARNFIAALDTDGASTAWDPNANGPVFALAVNGGAIYVGGRFTTIGTETRRFLAAIEVKTGGAKPWNPNVSTVIPSFTLSSAGAFVTFASSTDTAHVYALATSGLTVYAGGSLKTSGWTPRSSIAAFNTATGRPTAWNPSAKGGLTTPSIVRTLVVSESVVYVGGNFTSIGGAERNRLAALEVVSGNATPWNPNSGDEINAIAVADEIVYVGGAFTMINGQARTNIAALEAVTGDVIPWTTPPEPNQPVRSLVVRGTTVYFGGNFTELGSPPRNLLAALDGRTGLLTPWNPNASGGTSPLVQTLAISGSTVYAGGRFTMVGGQSRNSIVAINAESGIPTTWNPNLVATTTSSTILPIRSISVGGSTVYLGGEFTRAGSETRNNVAAVSADTAIPTAWNPNARFVFPPSPPTPPTLTPFVSALEAAGAMVFVGGNFNNIAGMTHSFFAPLGATPLNSVPTVVRLSPTMGERLQTLEVVFQGTNFIDDVSSVNVGKGIAVNSITVTSATSLTANITITERAEVGTRNFSVSNNPPGGGTSSFFPFMINNPAPTAASVDPAAGLRGETLEVMVNGANFISGVSSVSFGPEIIVNAIVVNSATLLTAKITIGANAVIGYRNVVVTNAFPRGGTATLADAFAVGYPVPTLISLTPENGARWETLYVDFTGAGFVEGITTVKVGEGITINSITVTSATSLTANLTIAGNAATGAHAFTLVNPGPGGGASENKNFTVNNPEPVLTRLAPASAGRGQTHNIALIGANFFRDASSVSFGSEIIINFITVNSDTQITANLTIPLRAENGNRDVYVSNAIPGGGTAALYEGFAVVNPRPTLISIVPTIGALNQTLNVSLSGTNFIDGISSVNFGEGITVNYFTVVSSTKIVANLKIEDWAPTEPHDVSVGNAEPGGGGVTLPSAFAVSGGAIVHFSVPNDILGARGDTVEIPLAINPSTRKVGSFDATLNFDPGASPFRAVLTYADFMRGSALSGDWQIDVHADSASVNIGAFTTNSSLTQAGTVIVLLFRVEQTATLGATVPLGLSDLSATNNNAGPLPTEGRDGLLTIAEATISGNLVYYLDDKPLAGDSVQVEILDPAALFQISNADGYFEFTGLPFGSDAILRPQRMVGNFPTGIITAGDALRAFKGRTDGPDPLNGYQSLAMDVNGDCQLTSGDALAILMRATGKLQGFYRYEEDERAIRLEDWRFVDSDFDITTDNWCEAPDHRSYSPLDEDQTEQHFIGIIRGDVNGSFSGPLAKIAGNGPVVTLSNPALIGNNQFNFTAEVNAADKAYNSFDLTFTFDAAAMSIAQVSFAKTLAPKNWQVDWNAGPPGLLRIAGFSLNEAAIKGNHPLLVIEGTLARPAKENQRLNLAMPFAVFGWNGKEIAAQTATGDLKFVARLPEQYALEQNYPNPFLRQAPRAATTIKYALPEAGAVSLRIYDVLGNVVRTLVAKSQNAGIYAVAWNGRKDNGSPAAGGLYFYRLEAGIFVKTNKLVLQK